MERPSVTGVNDDPLLLKEIAMRSRLVNLMPIAAHSSAIVLAALASGLITFSWLGLIISGGLFVLSVLPDIARMRAC